MKLLILFWKKYFKLVYGKRRVYGNFNYQCNVSAIHLHAFVAGENFTKVVRVCADCI
jgi:hypothetical protein